MRLSIDTGNLGHARIIIGDFGLKLLHVLVRGKGAEVTALGLQDWGAKQGTAFRADLGVRRLTRQPA